MDDCELRLQDYLNFNSRQQNAPKTSINQFKTYGISIEIRTKSVLQTLCSGMEAAVGLQKHQEDQNQGSRVGLGTLLGLILKGPRGSEFSKGVWERS